MLQKLKNKVSHYADLRMRFIGMEWLSHASALTAAAKIGPIEFQNQQALPIRSLAFSPFDGRPHPVSGSMG